MINNSLGGGGYTAADCEAACAEQNDCRYFQFYSQSGFCHMFASCNSMVTKAKKAVVYVRNATFANRPDAVQLDPSVSALTASETGKQVTQGFASGALVLGIAAIMLVVAAVVRQQRHLQKASPEQAKLMQENTGNYGASTL